MAYIPNRDDPYLPSPSPSIEEIRRQQRESDLQMDRDLSESPSTARVGLYAIAVVVVLGALFYGLNTVNRSTQTATSTPPSGMAQNTPAAPAPPVRNVTPGPNTAPGVTTGSAPANPATNK